MEWLADMKVIIFDMDGTLYQEDTYMDRYIRYLLEQTEWEKETEAAVADARKILSGKHPIKLGHFYHKSDGAALVHLAGRFAEGFTSDGAALDGLTFAERYESLSLDDPLLLYMGDPWGIVAAISHKYKIPEEKLKVAFERVREEMLLEPYRFGLHHEMLQSIGALDAVEKKILMTNTYEKSGIDFLRYMRIVHLFDEIHCGADKPFGIQKRIERLLEQGYLPHEILSIGDNPWNDLYPVKKIGGRTCFISPYPSGDAEQWDVRLQSLDELKRLLDSIQEYNTVRR